jgi:hypothetical protein
MNKTAAMFNTSAILFTALNISVHTAATASSSSFISLCLFHDICAYKALIRNLVQFGDVYWVNNERNQCVFQ